MSEITKLIKEAQAYKNTVVNALPPIDKEADRRINMLLEQKRKEKMNKVFKWHPCATLHGTEEEIASMRHTLTCFLKAYRRGRRHMRTIKAETCFRYGISTRKVPQPNPKGWRLEIGEEEVERLLKLCEYNDIEI